jgi:hypothetical protein
MAVTVGALIESRLGHRLSRLRYLLSFRRPSRQVPTQDLSIASLIAQLVNWCCAVQTADWRTKTALRNLIRPLTASADTGSKTRRFNSLSKEACYWTHSSDVSVHLTFPKRKCNVMFPPMNPTFHVCSFRCVFNDGVWGSYESESWGRKLPQWFPGVCRLPVRYAVWLLWEPTFRKNVSPSSSGWQESAS